MTSRLKKLEIKKDIRGNLVSLESNRQVPFNIKRVFYINSLKKKISRGNHAHYKTKQFLICINGSCKITLDNGKTKELIILDKPNMGIFQDKLIWGSMHDFSTDCVLLILASEYYDKTDYITDYDKFLKLV